MQVYQLKSVSDVCVTVIVYVYLLNIVILGSPFQFTVGPFVEGGAHKVRAGGTGLVRGEVNIAGKSYIL